MQTTETIQRSESEVRSRSSKKSYAEAQRQSGQQLAHAEQLPRISPFLLHWFTWYCRRYIRKHFHSLRVSKTGLPPDARDLPIVLYTNHASWWDPLVVLVVKDALFSERALFAPIDAAMLARYPMFAKLGFFGVEKDSRRGAAQFLRTSEVILDSPRHLMAVTPQSRLADARERPVQFQNGLGHLATRVERALFLPVAAEYVFWEERLPEILLRFGEPTEVRREENVSIDADHWTDLFAQKLEMTQNALSLESQRREPASFQHVLRGGAGQGGIYDVWRAFKAKLRHEDFRKEHTGK